MVAEPNTGLQLSTHLAGSALSVHAMCQGKGCNENFFSFLPDAYARALPVYLPVYLLPALLVHRNRLLSPSKGPAIWGKARHTA